MRTNERSLSELMKDVDSGDIQLPDFQRGWVWDDDHIKALIFSVINNFPVGAAMFLECGNENIRFKHRPIEGSSANPATEPGELILDGQQRLTSLYNALFAKSPVRTKTYTGKDVERYYYLDIEKALQPNADYEDIVISVPASKQITGDFGRKIEKDLSTNDGEFKYRMFPLNLILDSREERDWEKKYQRFYKNDEDVIQQFDDFYDKIIKPMQDYRIPVIVLDKSTPKEAICQVFENVNRWGVSLTVFELLTALFAMDDFQLREDWKKRKKKYFSEELLKDVTETDFLTALTLLASFKNGKTVSCKKKDVLSLQLPTYKRYVEDICMGFSIAAKLLKEERIFSRKDLPYTTQLIPLAAICAALMEGNKIDTANVKNKVKQWYWCGVFGELYGSANETRFANDITQVIRWITDNGADPKTVTDFFFNPTRLLGLQSRQAAAYKGIMARILKNKARDFISGREMDFTTFSDEKIDIHHIFPRKYCEQQGHDKDNKWNSIVNKTVISAKSNRSIGGNSPAVYLKTLEKNGSVAPQDLDDYVETHWIDHNMLRNNDFQGFIVDRAKKLLSEIEAATGKSISGKDSEEVRQAFGASLV